MMKCPNDGVEMKQVTKSNIIIDYCPKCGGVWLDKGELEKLIDAAKFETQEFAEDNVPFSDNNKTNEVRTSRRNQQHNRTNRKRREFENPLEDIFDFF